MRLGGGELFAVCGALRLGPPFSKLPVFGLASSLQKFPSHYGQHIFGIGVPRLQFQSTVRLAGDIFLLLACQSVPSFGRSARLLSC